MDVVDEEGSRHAFSGIRCAFSTQIMERWNIVPFNACLTDTHFHGHLAMPAPTAASEFFLSSWSDGAGDQ